ncbi:MAG: hypothetical protein OHK0046_25780 [Anaerolineae bacterium]
MGKKLIVYMIDGVSAEHYTTEKGRLPHFMALEKRGFRIENLHSEVLGTSLPGRTSMLTGVTADVSGVYGNLIWDGTDAFRYANPDDIRVPTIPMRAKQAGKRVAALGAGMIRPEDTDAMILPWWIQNLLIQRARDTEPLPADNAWVRVANAPLSEAFVRACEAAGYPTHYPQIDTTDEQARAFYGLMCDMMIADWVGITATSPDAPDLIWAEFLVTDSLQHYTGYKSEISQWAVMQADSALGRIMARLRAAGVEDEWNIAVMSDHGHSPIDVTLHPQVIIPGVRVQCEGGSLLVAPRDADELQMVTEKLAPFGVERYSNDCVPAELRDQVFVFMAPERTSFENDNAEATEPTGKPHAISSHGIRPGWAGDDRFALFAGPDVPQGRVEQAQAVQVAPTLAALLELPMDGFVADPVFQPAGVMS